MMLFFYLDGCMRSMYVCMYSISDKVLCRMFLFLFLGEGGGELLLMRSSRPHLMSLSSGGVLVFIFWNQSIVGCILWRYID